MLTFISMLAVLDVTGNVNMLEDAINSCVIQCNVLLHGAPVCTVDN